MDDYKSGMYQRSDEVPIEDEGGSKIGYSVKRCYVDGKGEERPVERESFQGDVSKKVE